MLQKRLRVFLVGWAHSCYETPDPMPPGLGAMIDICPGPIDGLADFYGYLLFLASFISREQMPTIAPWT